MTQAKPAKRATASKTPKAQAKKKAKPNKKKARKKPRKGSFFIALALVVTTLGLAAGISICVVKRALDYPNRAHKGEGVEVVVEIKRGMTFPEMAKLLHEKNVIDKPTWFRLYATHRGVSRKVRPGKYKLKDNWTPKQVLSELLKGVKRSLARVTLKEGWNMIDMFRALAEANVADATELEALARDPAFLKEHGITAKTAEGYLFPETYRFAVPSKPRKVLGVLIRQFKLEWNRIKRRQARALRKLRRKLEWTDHQVLIMASIVEKEAILAHERRTIAQVFINRLASKKFKPHLLQTDPTIRYGCMVPSQKSAACREWFDRRYPKDHKNPKLAGKRILGHLTRATLRDKDNPYNTYKHEGLPPGPIASPGRHALEATLRPDGSKHLYFVARKDKTKRHWFSRSRRQHERRVKQMLANIKKYGKQ